VPIAESGDQPTNPAVAGALRAVADRTRSPLFLVTREGRIRYANPAAGWLLGRTPEWLIGQDWESLVHPEDAAQVGQELAEILSGRGSVQSLEYRMQSADGSVKVLTAHASSLTHVPGVDGVLVSATDVTDQRANEKRLRELALTDPLTGLSNRNRLSDHLRVSIGTGPQTSVVFIEIDHFRRINASLGHTIGDIVLRSIAGRIGAAVPSTSLVARFGGDTFVVVLEGVDEESTAALVWELLARIANPLFVSGYELRVTASAGIARQDASATHESLLRDADVALTRAKAFRRGGAVMFNEQMRTETAARLALEADLRRAIQRGELRIHYQPVINFSSGEQEGSEALVRWQREGDEILGPIDFLPVAEEAGLIVAIGEWVLGAVLKDLQRDPERCASVNLSPRQLAVPGFSRQVERLLAVHDVAASRIAFEVTETVLVEDFELASSVLSGLRRLGCFVGLDDFGAGYSSLGYLRRLPLDFIKIDRSLIDAIDTDAQARTIVSSVVSLAKALSLVTIAEGVERESLVAPLFEMGCDYGQGWLFGRALPR